MYLYLVDLSRTIARADIRQARGWSFFIDYEIPLEHDLLCAIHGYASLNDSICEEF